MRNKEARTTFQTLGRRIKLRGEFGYIENYWEWLEDIIGRSKQVLCKNYLFNALYASLFIYDKNPHVFKACCEA